MRGACGPVGRRPAQAHRGGTDLPIHGDRLDVTGAVDQPLVEQPAQHQQLGPRAECHQRDQLVLVDKHRQRALDRNRPRALVAGFVAHGDAAQQCRLGRRHARRVGAQGQRLQRLEARRFFAGGGQGRVHACSVRQGEDRP
jgi:hypothetical protein